MNAQSSPSLRIFSEVENLKKPTRLPNTLCLKEGQILQKSLDLFGNFANGFVCIVVDFVY